MYKVDSLVLWYVSKVWDKYITPLNKDPVKFELRTELHSRARVPIPPACLENTITHLIANSMTAISGLYEHGMDIMEQWETDTLGRIVLRTLDIDENTIAIEVEDNGHGIDPYKVREVASRCHLPPFDEAMPHYDVINSLFIVCLTTQRHGGIGLAYCKHNVEKYGGKIYIAGTTYSKEDEFSPEKKDLVTIGQHHGKSRGTVVRMEFSNQR